MNNNGFVGNGNEMATAAPLTEKKENNVDEDITLESDIDPFKKHFTFPASWWVKALLFGPVLVPVRMVAMAVCILLAYIVARICMLGASDVETAPLTGWRRGGQLLVHRLMRAVIFCTGIIVTIEGTQDPDAGIIVVAPHTTIFDILAVFVSKACPVAKSALRDSPMLGMAGRLLQTVWVQREEQDSRQLAAQQISSRSKSGSWPPILIFPEGTNTNGLALLQFRRGAFKPGLPVQPMAIRWINRVDTVTWTWHQNLELPALLIATMATPYTSVSVKYLPTIHPTQDEMTNSSQYAERTRAIMSEALRLPTSSCTVSTVLKQQHVVHNNNVQKEDCPVPENPVKAWSGIGGLAKSNPGLASSSTSIDFMGNLTLGF